MKVVAPAGRITPPETSTTPATGPSAHSPAREGRGAGGPDHAARLRPKWIGAALVLLAATDPPHLVQASGIDPRHAGFPAPRTRVACPGEATCDARRAPRPTVAAAEGGGGAPWVVSW
ncbi:hypothetical protein [Dactylosporangium sp. NPDC050588]|uniref:hypothetical protein n=1 Tax=Dactylosporangium sp. NPDC050588 TaxID=3157211 RepID=UPI0033C4377E